MATRMQQRRGTAAQWTAANPVLAAGEIGFETDTNKFKMGNGTSTWTALTYFANATELAAAIDAVVGIAPETLDTLGELAATIGNDPDFLASLATDEDLADMVTQGAANLTELGNNLVEAINDHANIELNVHGIANTALLATTENVATAKSEAIAAAALDATSKSTGAVAEAVATITKESLGLSAVDNVEDASKPVSTAQAFAIDTAKTEAITAAGQAADEKISDHNLDETNVHGIPDTSVLVTQTELTDAIDGVTVDQSALAGTGLLWDGVAEQFTVDSTIITSAVSTHSSDTTDVHGIADTADLLLKSGGTMTGALTLSGAPSSSLHAATKQYVDNTASGVVAKPQVLGATVLNIDATYNNGTAGVGATLTHNTNGEFPALAGGAEGWAVGKGILVKSQTNKAQNGRYYISDMGSASTPYVLTRCGYCDEASEIPGAYIFVQDGTLAGTGWVQTVADATTFTVGTDDINVYQFSGSGTITAGTNISVSGNEVSLVATPELSGVEFPDGTQTKAGVPSITTFATEITSSATLAAGQADKFVPLNGAVTITLPSTGYSTGQSIDFWQSTGTGAQFSDSNGVVGTPGRKFRTTNSVVTAMKTSSGWLIFGDLSA